MQYILVAAISVIFTAGTMFGASQMPISVLDSFNDTFGATVTEISGSTQISAYPTIQNANVNNLNNNKMEMSTTSVDSIATLSNLASVGTLTSGSTGTGFSTLGTTSPSQYMTLIGDGDNAITVASSTGTNGQFWTSGGPGAYPSWTSAGVNQADNYTWTGDHTFQGTNVMATTTTISESTGGLAPAGSLMAYSTTTAPAGWLLADGTSYATATFPTLYAVIGYSYGGSGANFNVPDLQGRGVLMASSTANIGQTGGESNHTITQAEMPAHTHDIETQNSSGSDNDYVSQGNSAAAQDGSKATTSTGGGNAINVLDPYIVLNYIIKY